MEWLGNESYASYDGLNATSPNHHYTTTQNTTMMGLLKCGDAKQLCIGIRELFRSDYNISDPSKSTWIWASLGFFLPLAVFGTIGNIITIVMFSKYVKKTTTSIFIICLAIVDLLACGIMMPLWFSELILGNIPIDFFCKLYSFLSFFFIPMSGCILLVIAIDRFLIIFVIKTTVITRFRAKVIIAALFVLCLGFSLPQLFTVSTITVIDRELLEPSCEGQLECDTRQCNKIDLIPAKMAWDLMLAVILFFLIMVLCFSVMYSLIFVKVYRTHKKMLEWRSGSRQCSRPVHKIQLDQNTFASSSQEPDWVELSAMLENGDSSQPSKTNHYSRKKESSTNESFPKQIGLSRQKKRPAHLRTALTLSLVTCSFVVAYAPMVVLTLIGYAEPKSNSPMSFLWHMLFLNHILNPIIYSFMNPRFKDAVKGLVNRKTRQKHPS